MDLYTTNGIIIKQRQLTDAVTEIGLQFPFDKSEDALLYSLATYYLAFVHTLPRNFVFSTWTKQDIALSVDEFDQDAKKILIESAILVKKHAAILFSKAEIYFYTEPNTGIVMTNQDEELEAYKKVDFTGKSFVEAFCRSINLTDIR